MIMSDYPHKIVYKKDGKAVEKIFQPNKGECKKVLGLICDELKSELFEKYPLAFTKVKIYPDYLFDHVKKCFKAHEILRHTSLIPRIYHERIIFCKSYTQNLKGEDEPDEEYQIVELVMEKLGESLDNFVPLDVRNNFNGPGMSMNYEGLNEKDFEQLFPLNYFSADIIQKVKSTIIEITKLGIYLEDIHPGNFLLFQNTIFAIDFECVRFYDRQTF